MKEEIKAAIEAAIKNSPIVNCGDGGMYFRVNGKLFTIDRK